jgi:hypothetical protein
MDKLKSGRGGARKGAGRPQKLEEEKKVTITITLTKKVVDQLGQFKNRSKVVEDALINFFKGQS